MMKRADGSAQRFLGTRVWIIVCIFAAGLALSLRSSIDLRENFVTKPENTSISEQIKSIVEAKGLGFPAYDLSAPSNLTRSKARLCGSHLDWKRNLSKFSRSQQGEDQFLYLNFFKNLCQGTYVELGGLDGIRFSNSYLFRHGLDWRGILIEPNPRSFEKLKSNRPEDYTIHGAVCSTATEVHFIDSGVGRSGDVSGVVEFMSPSFIQKWHSAVTSKAELTKIHCKPLSGLLDESSFAVAHVDFLSIDVEGGEFEVLSTLDFGKHQFGVIFYEADVHNPVKNEAAKAMLKKKGYSFVGFHKNSNFHVNDNWENIYSHLT